MHGRDPYLLPGGGPAAVGVSPLLSPLYMLRVGGWPIWGTGAGVLCPPTICSASSAPKGFGWSHKPLSYFFGGVRVGRSGWSSVGTSIRACEASALGPWRKVPSIPGWLRHFRWSVGWRCASASDHLAWRTSPTHQTPSGSCGRERLFEEDRHLQVS